MIYKISRFQSVNVDTGADELTYLIPSIPIYAIPTGIVFLLFTCTNNTTTHFMGLLVWDVPISVSRIMHNVYPAHSSASGVYHVQT